MSWFFASLWLLTLAALVRVLRKGNPLPFTALNKSPTFSYTSPSRSHWLAALRVAQHYGFGPRSNIGEDKYCRALAGYSTLFNVPPTDEGGGIGGAVEVHVDDPLREAQRVVSYYRLADARFMKARYEIAEAQRFGPNAIVLVYIPGQHWIWVFLKHRTQLVKGKPPNWRWPSDAPHPL